EKGHDHEVKDTAKEKPSGPVAMQGALLQRAGDGQRPSPAPQARSAEPAPVSPAGPGGPDVNQSANGGWTFNPLRPGAEVAREDQNRRSQATDQGAAPPGKSWTQWLGLGGKVQPGQMNLNLTHQSVVASVGVDQLRKEREAD